MKIIINLIKVIYYYLVSSYKIWQTRHLNKDDTIYTTKTGIVINVYPGKKSRYDFIVRFKLPGKRERTPADVHLVVEMYVKYAYNPTLTLELKNHILEMFKYIKPINYFPPKLQFFKQEHIEKFKELDNVGEFPVEFLLVSE
ncbi:MAG: hypothetical protein NZ839_01660 [Endomicrobia bacterium]|nr:hypothetical protein [Endomicrobiia bacterium]